MEICMTCGYCYEPGAKTCPECGGAKSRRFEVQFHDSPPADNPSDMAPPGKITVKRPVQSKRHLVRPTYIIEVSGENEKTMRKVMVKAHELDEIVKEHRSDGWQVERVLSGEIFPFLGDKDVLMVVFKKDDAA